LRCGTSQAPGDSTKGSTNERNQGGKSRAECAACDTPVHHRYAIGDLPTRDSDPLDTRVITTPSRLSLSAARANASATSSIKGLRLWRIYTTVLRLKEASSCVVLQLHDELHLSATRFPAIEIHHSYWI
jgi:hypothetical protein